MAKKSEYCVFIGRFQPFHNAHLKIVKNALKESEKLVIAVGSYRAPQTIRNPWTAEERIDLITQCLEEEGIDCTSTVSFAVVRDYMYNDVTWLTSLQNAIRQIVGDSKSVKLIGHFKDDSSYYLKMFPQWELVPQPNFYGISGTDIRNAMYKEVLGEKPSVEWRNLVPHRVGNLLDGCIKDTNWESFHNLAKEHDFIRKYRAQWDDAPFPPVFVTTDNVVEQSGHILLVKRKINPGKGKLALPGGHVKQDEYIFDGAIRELYEETKLDFPKARVREKLVHSEVFDHPRRSLRGRTITHAFFYRLDRGGPLPRVKGSDDAAKAFWMPISEIPIHETEFFEDHVHIINHFIQTM